jgi:hypothetical protein
MTTAHASLVVVLRLSVEARALSYHFLAKKKDHAAHAPFLSLLNIVLLYLGVLRKALDEVQDTR